jgi:hypothetical protein
MDTTSVDLSAEISVFHDLVRAALDRDLSSEEQDCVAQLTGTIDVLIGDQQRCVATSEESHEQASSNPRRHQQPAPANV